MGDCPKPKSEMTFSDSSLMQRYATRNDVNMVEGSTSHFPQDPRPVSVDCAYTTNTCVVLEARLDDLTLESELETLGQARRAAVASGALGEGPRPR
ncbi:hypothetical protein HPB50_017845 [Hyalomma asiaticum]|uniref:Uncharacterized protein n=1 Tax=Hyalomma asiaticum TaxID=266040 RepID=A0ACB7TKC6_HYAAI|nr:hypothetical protein HPB50_017845 [Hyalomma asiaticum]